MFKFKLTDFFIKFDLARIKDLVNRPNSKVLISNFISLSVLQVLNYLLPLITLPYLTRTIGAELFGVLAIAAAIIVYFQTFVDFGFDYTATREIANSQKDIASVSKIFWTVTFAKTILMVISFIVLAILMAVIPYLREHYLIIFLTFLLIPGRILFPEWFFQGMERMKYITILNVISKAIFTGLVFTVIREREDYIYQPILIASGYLVTGVISFFIINKYFGVRMYMPSFKEIKDSIAGSYNIFLNLILPSLYNNLSTLLLGYWWGSTQAGILDAAKKVIMLSDQALSVLSRAFFPYLAKNISKHKFYVMISLIISSVFMLIYFFGADFIVKILFSPEFFDSKKLIILLAISPILFSLMNSYGTNYLILVHKETILRNITLVSSLLGFLAAIIFIYKMGAIGAALTLNFARGLISGLCYYYSKKVRVQLVQG
jgi:O-antigen/teichoic acid export membrane protein